MFDLNQNLFGNRNIPINVPENVDVVIVSDLFLENYPGGAERTTEALFQYGNNIFNVFKLHSKNVSMDLLSKNYQKHWIFCNFSQLDYTLIPTIIANIKYSIVEYDYKYCKARLPALCEEQTGNPCDCYNKDIGKIVSAFYYGAKSLFWMSEQQRNHYFNLFPFLEEKTNTVLSSVFDDHFFAKIKELRKKYENNKNNEYIILDSNSWIKNAQGAEKYCKKNNLKYKKVFGLSYNNLLEELAKSKGLIFLPHGKNGQGDTCPRFVIEAKLLNCDLIINENVEHAKELWWQEEDLLGIESYLYMSRQRFWQQIKNDINWQPKISGYTTTRNCNSQNYPWKESISSFLEICDEVIVADSSSPEESKDDKTWEELKNWSKKEPKLKVYHNERDYNSSDAGTIDGKQKAFARSLCSLESDFLIQFDVDETTRTEDKEKWKSFFKNVPKNIDLLVMPVFEFFGKNKLRVDVNCWKPRITRNLPHITHGIPAQLRSFNEKGALYCNKEFASDGCDYIHVNTSQPLKQNVATFYTNEMEQIRQHALQGNKDALKKYENILKQIYNEVPAILHYSWISVYEKMKRYKVDEENGYKWQNMWLSLYNKNINDEPKNNNFFPEKSWKEVSKNEMKKRANEIEEKLGGFVAHFPLNFEKGNKVWMDNWIEHSEEMKKFLKKNI